MARRLLALLALTLVAVACGGSSPTSLTCPTKAQSVTFTAAGSCGGAGSETITISTQPGLCSLLVKGGVSAGLPTQGQFTGTATSAADYDLLKGNWELFVNQGNATDGSEEVTCDVSMSSGAIDLMCSGMICQPDDGCGAPCNDIDCTEHLTQK